VGQLIGFSGAMGAMRLGPRASRLLNEAVAMGPDNPRVWMLRGVSAMFKPRIFGGGLGKAEDDLQHALTLFAGDVPQSPAPWWGHAETYGWLGQLYARQGKVEQARASYARALSLEPANAWVRDYLLPALDKAAR
jgi:Flp pilus assembly protein TadD